MPQLLTFRPWVTKRWLFGTMRKIRRKSLDQKLYIIPRRKADLRQLWKQPHGKLLRLPMVLARTGNIQTKKLKSYQSHRRSTIRYSTSSNSSNNQETSTIRIQKLCRRSFCTPNRPPKPANSTNMLSKLSIDSKVLNMLKELLTAIFLSENSQENMTDTGLPSASPPFSLFVSYYDVYTVQVAHCNLLLFLRLHSQLFEVDHPSVLHFHLTVSPASFSLTPPIYRFSSPFFHSLHQHITFPSLILLSLSLDTTPLNIRPSYHLLC